ncbi:transmembrane amino acid transporter protein-domain-containing protein [Radiomyces spectabilis]|uniref:transmembrane amino acid transporter protein-domain-containing protein n=1 Tax=Radiomyces spectabilis TaxID=64574 RepID=UPI00221FAAFD|nr:transmembrane amino acid transporter protein-domain-containing protein [Radiomyces spectabilis]KAI8372961.1 transmembrane amino acid transporter protein-domain-containing protein [Radiomyces spectabilis]
MATRYQPLEQHDTTSSVSSFPTSSVTNVDSNGWLDDHRPLLSRSSAPSSLYQSETSVEDGDHHHHSHATATPMSCAVNLANTILGTGMLAMPSAVASVGIIPGVFVILFSAAASAAGLYFLSRCAARTEGRHASFFAISKLTWPRIAVLFDLAIAIKCFGVAISYLIIIGDLMPQVVASFSHHGQTVEILLDRRFWITVFMVIAVLPLSFLRKLDSLKYTSLVALIAVIYLCTIVIYHYISPNYPPPPPEDIELVHFSTKFFSHLPVFVFAFTCHQNIFAVYNELKDNSQLAVSKVIATSIGTSAFIYEAIAILGYLSFGKNVRGNIIMEYPPSMFVAGGRLAIVVLVVFSYPLQAHPCRASLDKVLAWRTPEARGLKVPPPPSACKYFAMTTAILIFSYLIAITVSQLDLVLAFVGSTGSTTISFILPGLFYYKIHENDPWKPGKIGAVALAVYGVLVMSVCLTFNILRLMA